MSNLQDVEYKLRTVSTIHAVPKENDQTTYSSRKKNGEEQERKRGGRSETSSPQEWPGRYHDALEGTEITIFAQTIEQYDI